MNKKHAWIAGLAAWLFCGSALAQQIPFFDIRFETTAIALSSDGPADVQAQSGVLGGDAVSVSAASIGTSDVATAGAIVGPDLLSTSVDVSAGDLSSAVASSRFTGSFVNAGSVDLNLDFSWLDLTTGTGAASTTLFVSLVSNGVTLFQDYVQGPWHFAYAANAGTTSVLDLTLASEASAAYPGAGVGNASSFGLVSVAVAVPEASTWLMFVLGLGGVALFVRSRSSSQSPLG